MPKIAIDYSRTCMYKICCKDPSIKDEYYGHTTDKTKRKHSHKSVCHKPDAKGHNTYVYQFIRNNGGWDNWTMVVIEEYPCENINQARARERYWIETQQATLNKQIPTKTQQEWIEEHKEEIIEYKKQYYEEHREELLEQKKKYREEFREKLYEKFECECGGEYTKNGKSKHFKTKKHTNYFK